jgi:hypothetical protein
LFDVAVPVPLLLMVLALKPVLLAKAKALRPVVGTLLVRPAVDCTMPPTLDVTDTEVTVDVMLGISTAASVCVSEPPVAPIVCASRIGEKRIPEVVKVPVTLFENVIDVPEMTVILVPLGNFGCDANMPTARPAADANIGQRVVREAVGRGHRVTDSRET